MSIGDSCRGRKQCCGKRAGISLEVSLRRRGASRCVVTGIEAMKFESGGRFLRSRRRNHEWQHIWQVLHCCHRHADGTAESSALLARSASAGLWVGWGGGGRCILLVEQTKKVG